MLIFLAIITDSVLRNNVAKDSYDLAKSHLASGMYEKAIEEFTQLGNYKDSSSLISESKYQRAKSYLASEQYEKAIEEFTQLDNYKDSSNLINESKYRIAKSYFSSGKFVMAIYEFTPIKDYKDSAELILESKYQRAIDLFTKKEYKTAQKIFTDLGKYKDSNERKKDADYQVELEKLKPTATPKPIPTQNPIYIKKSDPEIGMSASEVKNSTWGNPDDINRTTTAFGVHEQWVYDYRGYIYLDDGVVTAIQD